VDILKNFLPQSIQQEIHLMLLSEVKYKIDPAEVKYKILSNLELIADIFANSTRLEHCEIPFY